MSYIPARPPPPPSPAEPALLVGATYMMLSTLLFPIGNIAVKILSLGVGFPLMVLVGARYVGQMASVFILFWHGRRWTLFHTKVLPLQLFRSSLLLGTTTFFFAALSTIPIGMATAINFTYPAILTLLAAIILKEKVGIHRWMAVIACFSGAMLVIRIWENNLGTDLFTGQLYAAGCALCYAVFQMMSKIVLRHDDALTTNAYTALVGAIGTALLLPILLAYTGIEFVSQASPTDWGLLLLVGMVYGVGHFFIVKALAAADASFVAPFAYVHVGTSALAGYLAFGETIDWLGGVGMVVIIMAGAYVSWREHYRLTHP